VCDVIVLQRTEMDVRICRDQRVRGEDVMIGVGGAGKGRRAVGSGLPSGGLGLRRRGGVARCRLRHTAVWVTKLTA
jgi:hypothetical protein